MTKSTTNHRFARLFKKFRLRSEIESLSEFGNLFAENGFVYENSLFTKWQNGSRVPKDRKTLLGIVNVFIKKGGICLISEVNQIFESANQGLLTNSEKSLLPRIDENSVNIELQNVGSALKNNRLQKHVSQSEMAMTLELPNEEYVDKIERGELESVGKNLIKKYCRALGLQDNEINSILLLGNYLPSKEEIRAIQKKIGPVLEAYQYSAVLYDFCWRIIYINRTHANMLEMNRRDVNHVHNSNLSAIEIVFDPNFKQNKILSGDDKVVWHENLLRFIVHFKSLQKTVTKTDWYKNLIRKMTNNNLFRKIWLESEQKKDNFITTRKGYKIFMSGGVKLAYHIYIVPLFDDPRFEIEYYSPADLVTLQYLQKNSIF